MTWFSLAILVAGTILSYKVSDWAQKKGVREHALWGVFFFFGVFILVGWMNGVKMFGAGEACYGSGITKTC